MPYFAESRPRKTLFVLLGSCILIVGWRPEKFYFGQGPFDMGIRIERKISTLFGFRKIHLRMLTCLLLISTFLLLANRQDGIFLIDTPRRNCYVFLPQKPLARVIFRLGVMRWRFVAVYFQQWLNWLIFFLFIRLLGQISTEVLSSSFGLVKPLPKIRGRHELRDLSE